MDHAIGPVLQVNIHAYASFFGLFKNLVNIPRCSAGFSASWPFQWFRDPFVSRLITLPPGPYHPVERKGSVNKTQYLNPVKEIFLTGPFGYLFTEELSFRNPGRRNLNPSTFISSRSICAIASFSALLNETPVVCSPSRRVYP
jgi:hypothetical protein